MQLELKQTIKNTFKIKDISIYAVTFAILSTLSGLIYTAKNINYKMLYYIISLFLVYIPVGYLINVIHNKMNQKDEIKESFSQTFFNSAKSGINLFIGLFFNTIIYAVASSFLLIGTILITKTPVTTGNPGLILKNPVNLTLFLIIMVFAIMLFNFMPIVFAKDYSLKSMFNWIGIFKPFFKHIQETLLVLVLYTSACILLVLTFYSLSIFVDYSLIRICQYLLKKGFVYSPFALYISQVIAPFFVAFFHYYLMTMLYSVLSNIFLNSELKLIETSEKISNEKPEAEKN